MDKPAALRNLLRSFHGAVIAFSGGVDSTFLAVTAHEILGPRSLAVTAVSPAYPEHQLRQAQAIAARYGLNHEVIGTGEFECPDYVANPSDRCYYCKKVLFGDLRRLAEARGLDLVLDGANLDDLDDHRPGHRAARELGVRSPLQEAGLTKTEIRRLSREMGLPTWDQPAYACLASRIPYGREITREALARIERGEEFLASLGLREIRLRDHHPVARLEVGPAELDLAWRYRQAIAAKLHELGYPYVALDLDGFRSGSMNETLATEETTVPGQGGSAEIQLQPADEALRLVARLHPDRIPGGMSMVSKCALNTLNYYPERCTNCGMCITVCPHEVFATGKESPTLVRPEACMECGACARNCPAGAIEVESGVGCAGAMMMAALRGKKEVTCGGDSCCGS